MTLTDDAPILDWHSLNDRLVATLKPFAAPVAISFHAPGETPTGTPCRTELSAPQQAWADGSSAGGLCLLDSRSG